MYSKCLLIDKSKTRRLRAAQDFFSDSASIGSPFFFSQKLLLSIFSRDETFKKKIEELGSMRILA